MAISPKLPAGRDRGLESRPSAARELLALGTMQLLQLALAQSMALESNGLQIDLPVIRRLHFVLGITLARALLLAMQKAGQGSGLWLCRARESMVTPTRLDMRLPEPRLSPSPGPGAGLGWIAPPTPTLTPEAALASSDGQSAPARRGRGEKGANRRKATVRSERDEASMQRSSRILWESQPQPPEESVCRPSPDKAPCATGRHRGMKLNPEVGCIRWMFRPA